MRQRFVPLVLCAWISVLRIGHAQQWREMDYGPMLTATVELSPDNVICKAISVRLDEGPGGVMRGRAFLTFDTDTLRCVGAWTGTGMIDGRNVLFDGTHNAHCSIRGRLLFLTQAGPGWADPETGTFEDTRILGTDGKHYGPLQHHWGKWNGLYRSGDHVVFSYHIGETAILEMGSLEQSDNQTMVARTLNIGPRSSELVMRVAHDARRTVDLVPCSSDANSPYPLAVLGDRPADASRKDAGQSEQSNGLQLDGSSYFQVEHDRAFDLTDRDFTIAARIRTRRGGTILAHAPATGDWAPNGKTLFVRNGKLGFDIGWVGVVTADRRVDDGQWHDVAVTYDAARGEVSLFVDGRRAGGGQLRPKAATPDYVIRLGYTSPDFPGPQSGWDGEFQHVAFYQRRLSAEDLRPSQLQHDQTLAALWKFDTGSRDETVDATGHGHVAHLVRTGADTSCGVAIGLVGAAGLSWEPVGDGELRLRIPVGAEPLQLKLLYAELGAKADTDCLKKHLTDTDPPADLSDLTRGGPPLWTERMETDVRRFGAEKQPFVAEDLSLPVENPWKSWMSRFRWLDFFKPAILGSVEPRIIWNGIASTPPI